MDFVSGRSFLFPVASVCCCCALASFLTQLPEVLLWDEQGSEEGMNRQGKGGCGKGEMGLLQSLRFQGTCQHGTKKIV